MVLYEGLIIVFSSFFLGILLLKVGINTILFFIDNNQQQSILQEIPGKNLLQIAILTIIVLVVSVFLAIYPIIKMNISTILSNEK